MNNKINKNLFVMLAVAALFLVLTIGPTVYRVFAALFAFFADVLSFISEVSFTFCLPIIALGTILWGLWKVGFLGWVWRKISGNKDE